MLYQRILIHRHLDLFDGYLSGNQGKPSVTLCCSPRHLIHNQTQFDAHWSVLLQYPTTNHFRLKPPPTTQTTDAPVVYCFDIWNIGKFLSQLKQDP
ncbi:hypothetical protein HYQ46_004942 [Verticillium longisporum]|nr:hypothetical protein HYQ46_004942 [Verticillium longisporum]